VIVDLDGEEIDEATELTTELAEREPGDEVELTVMRDRTERSVRVEVATDVDPGDVVSIRVRDPELGETICNYRTRR
jgi:S1-C subfamily serine protease